MHTPKIFKNCLVTIHTLIIGHGSHNPSSRVYLPIITRTKFIIVKESIMNLRYKNNKPIIETWISTPKSSNQPKKSLVSNLCKN